MSHTQKILHTVLVIVLGLGAFVGTSIMSVSLMVSRFVIGETPQNGGWLLGPVVLLALTIAVCSWVIAKRIRWHWLAFAAVPIASVFVFLAHDDSAPPALPDLGPRVGVDDPGFQHLMWFAEKSPWSRLRETGAPSLEPDLPRLPKEPVDWAQYVTGKQAAIEQAVKENALGQEWIAVLSERPPAGICPLVDLDHLLSYRAIRNTTEPLLALAYARAFAGQRDEAVRMALPVVQSMYNLRRTSANIVHAMIATVVLKQCYAVIGEILRLGPLETVTSRQLVQALEAAPSERQVFRNTFLGESDFLHFTFARLRRGFWDFSPSGPASYNRRVEQALCIGGTLIFHPNRTERQMKAVYAQMCSVAETRNSDALAAWLPDWGDESQLRNPVGRLLGAMAVPAFTKIPKEIWKSEDLRRELMAKVKTYSASSTDTR